MDIEQHLLDRVTETGDKVAKTEQKVDDLIGRIDRFLPYVKGIDDRLVKVEMDQKVTMWRVGTLTALAGSALSFVIVWIFAKFGIHIPQ